MTVYTLRSPHTATNRARIVSGPTDDVLQHLRVGTRPARAGEIANLNPKMEAAFRSGQLFLLQMEDRILPERVKLGDTSLRGADWEEFSLPKKPSLVEKQLAFRAYQDWRQQEIFAPAADNEAGSLAAAQADFDTEFGSLGLSLIHPHNADEVAHVGDLLQLFAREVLERRDLVSKIDLNAEDAPRLFSMTDKTLRFVNPGSRWDRYLYSKIFLTAIGRAAFYTLPREMRDKFHLIYQSNPAFFAHDPTGDALKDQAPIPTFIDFFSINYMQFHLLGQGLIDQGSRWQQRELRDMYAQNFSTLTVQAFC